MSDIMEQVADLQKNFIRLSSRISKLEDTEKERNLKPCPFCRSRAEIWDDRNVSYWISCRDALGICGISTKSYKTREEAITQWERRA